ncbi:hypothetical protein KUM42_14715 [Modestobacter sp. L9-4]|uniref:hypothetical protein n=1 Tax=Modestobacter sp. L9-4 TaxID=2851567 RepID=UPI001C7872E1|nr:hypothetical protein [Modestobacter sp. L9-4]QXG75086.1 hypothetical protein KUM42_14715 [Modestobacter sp. L9-4]
MTRPHTGEPGHPADSGQPGAPQQDWDAAPPWSGPPAPWGPPGYGPPAAGGYLQPPPYGPPGPTPPPWSPYPGGPPPRSRTGPLWTLVGVLTAAVVVLATLLIVGSGSGSGSGAGPDTGPLASRPDPVPAPAATLAPTGLGDDAALDRLAQQCSDGQMNPCDDLYDESFPGSDYEAYADTCAGRRPPGQDTYCGDDFYDS